MLPDLRNPFFGDVVDGAQGAARAAGQTLLIATGSQDAERERHDMDRLPSSRIYGR
ncbi:hypothetical protein [Georgenia yuyongxinii]